MRRCYKLAAWYAVMTVIAFSTLAVASRHPRYIKWHVRNLRQLGPALHGCLTFRCAGTYAACCMLLYPVTQLRTWADALFRKPVLLHARLRASFTSVA